MPSRKEEPDETLSGLERFRLQAARHAELARIQVDADVIYHNRTSVITLVQGLCFVAFGSTIGGSTLQLDVVALVVAIFGLALAVTWVAFEQRNQAYFDARGIQVALSEQKMLEEGARLGLDVTPFWSFVPQLVRKNAKWYQRASAARIQRLWIPISFVFVWLTLGSVVGIPVLGHLID